MFYQYVSSNFLIKMCHKNISLNCVINISHSMFHQCVSLKFYINMSHHILSKCLIKPSHKNVSTKFLIISHHVSKCLIMGPHVSLLSPSLKHCLGFLTSLTMAHNRTSDPTNKQRHPKYRAFQICLTNVF